MQIVHSTSVVDLQLGRHKRLKITMNINFRNGWTFRTNLLTQPNLFSRKQIFCCTSLYAWKISLKILWVLTDIETRRSECLRQFCGGTIEKYYRAFYQGRRNKQFIRRILYLNLINYTRKFISFYCLTYSNISEADHGQCSGQTADEERPVRMDHHVR